MIRRLLFNKVVEEKPVYKYTYTTTDELILSDLIGVQNHKYENGVGSFETSNKSCISFEKQNTLESIVIPNGVTIIGPYVFSHCDELTGIEIPSSVTSIINHAFENCFNLTSIIIDGNNTKYDSRENCNAVIETESNTLVAGCKTTIIPNSVTSIGNSAFYQCDGLTSVVIPSSVTSIEEWAFSLCDGLTSVVIPSSVTSIGEYAFNGCSGLTSVVIGNGVTSIGSRTFQGCSKLTEILSLNTTSPTLHNDTFIYVCHNGVLKVPEGSDYSSWMGTSAHYLGYYKWTIEEIETL